MDVQAEYDSQGTQVHVVTKSRWGALQVIDWGEAKKFHREILACLRAPKTSDS